MYRSGELHREFGMRGGPYTGGRLAVPTRALSERTRRRLSEALLGDVPCTILSEGPPRTPRSRQLIGVAAGAVALFTVAGWGYGILGDTWAIQPRSVILAYAGAIAVFAWFVLELVRGLRREGLVPLPEGRYLLPYDLVEIAGGVVTIRPFGDARQVKVDDAKRCVRILYADGAVEVVSGRPLARGPSPWVRVLTAQHEIEEATYGGKLLEADPLSELRDATGWTSSARGALACAPKARAPSSPLVSFAVVVLAAAVAPSAWTARNRASDDAMFARATASADYRAYLRAGGTRHRASVDQSLLPRAALDEAERLGDARSLRAFLREFPASRYEDEARARLNDACVSELAGQPMDRLRSFGARNPDCHVEQAVQARLHALEEQRFEEAARRGVVGLRGYIHTLPDDPFLYDRAVAKLAEVYQLERHQVQVSVERAELRDVLLGIAGRAQREDMPGELCVPVTIVDGGDLEADPRDAPGRVLAGFDAAIHDLLDNSLVAIYHPSSVASADFARAHTLRIVIRSSAEGDETALVRYELASGDRTLAKWSRTVAQPEDPRRFGAELARGAISL